MISTQEAIPVANVVCGEEEARAVYEVAKSGWLSAGPRVRAFEEAFAKYVGVREAIAVNNGTAALHVVLAALGIGPGDEVILPTLTFISTANVVLYQGATPVLAECDPQTYNITPEEIEKRITAQTKAVIAVDMNGMPFDYDAITEVCRRKRVHLIADSAESLGATYKGRKIGAVADIHCFSFFPNKNVTTGEGGMIVARDVKLSETLRQLRNQGQDGRYNHVHLGFNYRMTELQAAVGLVQLGRVDKLIDEKAQIATAYNRLLAPWKKVLGIPHLPSEVTRHAWYMYAIRVDEKIRDAVVAELAERKIETRLSFPPIHVQPYYQKRFGFKAEDLPISYHAWKRLIDIPLWAGMGAQRQQVVVDALGEIFNKLS